MHRSQLLTSLRGVQSHTLRRRPNIADSSQKTSSLVSSTSATGCDLAISSHATRRTVSVLERQL